MGTRRLHPNGTYDARYFLLHAPRHAASLGLLHRLLRSRNSFINQSSSESTRGDIGRPGGDASRAWASARTRARRAASRPTRREPWASRGGAAPKRPRRAHGSRVKSERSGAYPCSESLIDIFSTFYIVLHTTSHTRTRHTTSPMQNARHIPRGRRSPQGTGRRAFHAATNLKYCRVLQVYTAGRCRRHDPEQSVLSARRPCELLSDAPGARLW